MRLDTFQNPILPGFYPDPSICAANGKYYIVTSSFYYFPGLPIFESEDLVHWRQIGHAINRPDQLDYRDCDNSEGLWAATIRYHDGRFYIVNTLDVNGREHRYNYVITAENPAGPWSDAVIVEGADGIEPLCISMIKGVYGFVITTFPKRLRSVHINRLSCASLILLHGSSLVLNTSSGTRLGITASIWRHRMYTKSVNGII